ncbi:MAG: hypothetical protein ACLP1X_26740 [Polyangiaceae bacterium]
MRNAPTVAPRSKLFHAIVVVGLSTAATGCGTSGQSGASEDAGEAASTERPADTGGSDAPSEVGSILGGTDASDDAGIPIHRSDAGDAAPDCGPAANPGPDGGCWPLFV